MSIPSEVFYATPLIWVFVVGALVKASETTEARIDKMNAMMTEIEEKVEEEVVTPPNHWEEVILVLEEIKDIPGECPQ